MIGADTTARFMTVECADDYYESLDMATALHPQTLLCYEMYDQPLTREHGAPLRLNVPTKIGYKQAKYLTDLKVTMYSRRSDTGRTRGTPKFYGSDSAEELNDRVNPARLQSKTHEDRRNVTEAGRTSIPFCACVALPLGERDLAVRDGGQRTADLSCVSRASAQRSRRKIC